MKPDNVLPRLEDFTEAQVESAVQERLRQRRAKGEKFNSVTACAHGIRLGFEKRPQEIRSLLAEAAAFALEELAPVVVPSPLKPVEDVPVDWSTYKPELSHRAKQGAKSMTRTSS